MLSKLDPLGSPHGDPQRLRPACANAQSDQSLCYSLEYSMTVLLLTKQRLEFLSLKGGCTGSPESTLVIMPHCWKPYVAAHISKVVLKCKVQIEIILTTSGNFWRPWNLRFSICKSLRCKLYHFWPYSLLEVVSFFKKPLRCCLYPGNSLIDGDSIPVELPCVCLAPYCVKAGLISLSSPDDT